MCVNVFTFVNIALFTFVTRGKKYMQHIDRYDQFFETQLRGRYITLAHLQPLLERYKKVFKISEIGRSENGIEIPMISLGTGTKKVLAWSQMHGNESTTTKAVFDFLSFLTQKEFAQGDIETFLTTYSLYIIPILNPDGATTYTRENANGVDLNRDAQQHTQSESRVLATLFMSLQPDLCLNLHDQRTIYGIQKKKPATVSFLAPSADTKRTKTPARKMAMKLIGGMARVLHAYIPGQVGRYDDSFNINCVGDTFQKEGVPTILFEAGHFPEDYEREETRKYICLAFLALFGFASTNNIKLPYRSIPKNTTNFRDVILRNIRLSSAKKTISVALQYKEVLRDDSVHFVAVIDEIGKLSALKGHLEIDANEATILVNSQEKLNVGDEVVEIRDKKNNSLLYSSI